LTPILVPAILVGLAIIVMAVVAFANARKGAHPDRSHRKQAAPPGQMPVGGILVHAINDDRCVGCDACVAVCPTNVLDLINNKSRVLRFQDCIQCEQCMWACPTQALVMHPEGTEPPRLKMAEIDENFETAVKGQYLIGEVAGKPLVKNAANLGRAVVEHMLTQGGLRAGAGGGGVVDVAVVGSGPGGLSAALTCIRRGLSYVVLEKEQCIASTVSRYPKGKWVMAEPYDVRNLSYLPVFDSSKEQMVPIWEDVVQRIEMNIKRGEPVETVEKGPDGIFTIRTTVAEYKAQRVVLGIGTRGKPRTLGVPGENLPKVMSLLEDPDNHRGQSVLVIGGGDSALEAAMALADAGARVVLSYRGKNFSRAQKKNQSAIESYESQKRIKVLFQSGVMQFTEDTVTIQLADNTQKSYPNHAAFVLIGAEPPVAWLKKVGVNVVERPHSFQLGKSDEIVMRLVPAEEVQDCPEEAEAAVFLAREGRIPEAVQKRVDEVAASKTIMFGQPLGQMLGEPVTGPKGWLKSAKTMFTQALRLDQPMPLSEFAKRAQTNTIGPSRSGRRDALSAAERTRVLRMLRDEGGRLADEDTQMLRTEDVAPLLVPPPAQPAPKPMSTVFAHGAPSSARSSQAVPAMPSAPQQPAYNQTLFQTGARPAAVPQQARTSQPVPMQPALNQTGARSSQAVPAFAGQPAQAASDPYSATLLARPGVPAAPTGRAPAAQPHHAHASSNANVIRRGGAFDEEPTRQVDGDAALSALLDGDPSQTGPLHTSDAGATQALHGAMYHDPLSATMEEPTRIGNLAHSPYASHSNDDFPADNLQEPTRAVDPYAALRSSSPGGDTYGKMTEPAPTQAINLTQMGRPAASDPHARTIRPGEAAAPGRKPPQDGRK
jgi:thioredoxin reductase/NAD-dependent dihydropyrimidine dehydrogenase PreA subunit